MINPTLQLLNNEVTEFDAVKILKLIPENWSVEMVKKFIIKSLRRSMHQRRISLISKGLMTKQNTSIKVEMMNTEKKSLFVSENR